MNIKIDVDVTPQELRTFLGLPDVEPMQKELMEKISERMRAGVDGYDPMTLMKPFLPQNFQTLEALQKAFWQAMTGGTRRPEKSEDKG